MMLQPPDGPEPPEPDELPGVRYRIHKVWINRDRTVFFSKRWRRPMHHYNPTYASVCRLSRAIQAICRSKESIDIVVEPGFFELTRGT